MCVRITHARHTPGSNQRDMAVTVPLSQTFRESSRGVIIVVVAVAVVAVAAVADHGRYPFC